MDRDDSLIGIGLELVDNRVASGELRLAAAVLENAVEEARRGDRDAIAWLASDDDIPSDGWCFVTLCTFLDADPNCLRDEIRAFIAAHPYVWRPKRRARELDVAA